MKATIWHNPRCSKSRAALDLLNGRGAEVTVVEYLKTPPTRAEIAALFARADISPCEGLRADAPRVADDDAAIDLMARDPSTVERPLVATDKGVRLCRPPERVLDIL